MGKHHGGGGKSFGGGSSHKPHKPASSSFKPHKPSVHKPAVHKPPVHKPAAHKPHGSSSWHSHASHYTPAHTSHASHGSHRHRHHGVSHFEGEGPGLLESLWEFLFGAREPVTEPGDAALRAPEPAPIAQAPVDPRVAALRGMHRVPMTTVDWRVYRDAPDPGGEHSRRWAELRDLATRVLAHDPLAYHEALTICGCLVGVHGHVGQDGVRVALREREGHVDVRAPLGTQVGDVVQTTSERLDLYQDYVCGLTLRVARELLAVLPIDVVTVDLWNVTPAAPAAASAGAYREGATPPANVRIASMRCDRNTLAPVPWDIVDASQLVESLPHQMRFVADQGFFEVAHVGA